MRLLNSAASKRIVQTVVCLMLAVLFLAGNSITAQAATEHGPRVIDRAGVLTEDEAIVLTEKCDELSYRQNVDIVVITDYDSQITSPMETADNLYDYGGYGMGEDRSGILLYVNYSTHDYWFTTAGYGITAFTDAGIDYLGDVVSKNLRDNPAIAFDTFVIVADDFIFQAKSGNPYDVGSMPKQPKAPFPFLMNLVIAVAVGFIIAGIYVAILKSQLKSVAPADSAANYVVNNSLKIKRSQEYFLYRTVHVTAHPKPSSSGGSSTHMSSSGVSHGGGGGKF